MLHRKCDGALLAISQPAHSWLSGQLARAWGNDLFGAVQPLEEVVLAAGLHDVGFLEWEQSPTLNPKTGWPCTFMELPAALHLDIWTRGIQQTHLLNRYAALLVSLHYTGLAQRHPVAGPPEAERQQANFLSAQRQFQASLVAELRKDPQYAPYLTEDLLQRNARLIAVWDWMSLLIGFGAEQSVRIDDVPARGDKAALELAWTKGHTSENATLSQASSHMRIRPWPFHLPAVHLLLEGRRLESRFKDEAQMREQLQRAPIESLSIVVTHE